LNWVACSPKLVWRENLQEPSIQSILNYIMVKFNIPCFHLFPVLFPLNPWILGHCWWMLVDQLVDGSVIKYLWALRGSVQVNHPLCLWYHSCSPQACGLSYCWHNE
jgi:hypothetical protein